MLLPAAELPRLPRARAGARAGRERRRRARDRPRRPDVARRARGAGRVRLRDGDRRRPGGGQLAVVRRPALRIPRGRRATSSGGCPVGSSARPSTSTAAARSSSRCRRASSTSAARRRPRTSRRTRPCSRSPGSRRSPGSGPRGCARWGRRASRSRSTRASASRSSRRSTRPSFKEVAFRTPIPAREVVRRARERGVHPGYALGRDYEGMDDVLLVALTEKRTVEDVDRLATCSRRCARERASRDAPGRTRRSSSSARGRVAGRDVLRVPIFPSRSSRARCAARDPPRLPEVSEPELVRHFTDARRPHVRRRHGLLPARLLHDEAQPARERAARRASRASATSTRTRRTKARRARSS